MLTTHTAVHIVTTTNKENDSPAIDREGGVENQSTDRITPISDSETDLGQPCQIPRITDSETDEALPRRTTENMETNQGQSQRIAESIDAQITQKSDSETNHGQSQRTTDKNMCTQCHRSFETERGLKIHQGKKCMKKTQCGSTDRKTCTRPTQDANHSSRVNGTAETSGGMERKPKVAWPAAKEKASYRNLEEKVCKKIYKMKGTVQERLTKLAKTIYEEGIESFGEVPTRRKKEDAEKKGKSRRERKMTQLRKEKKNLQKRWLNAKPEEKDGLNILYIDLKKKCRDMERNLEMKDEMKDEKRVDEQENVF